jgi:uncharacterized protein
MNQSHARLSATDPKERVLLLSHCMRPSGQCPAKFTRNGLQCTEECMEECVLGRLRRAAIALGYKGVCIAAGGTMALNFVAEHDPRGIVAVACERELAEGIDGVGRLSTDEDGKEPPVIVVVPLLKDGCVDTEVDEALALETIAVGCYAESER